MKTVAQQAENWTTGNVDSLSKPCISANHPTRDRAGSDAYSNFVTSVCKPDGAVPVQEDLDIRPHGHPSEERDPHALLGGTTHLRAYEWASTNTRMQRYFRDAVVNGLACFCRAYWSNLDRDDSTLILLNLLLAAQDIPDHEFETLLTERLKYGGKDNITRADVSKNRKMVMDTRAWVASMAHGGFKESVRGEQVRKGDLIIKKGLGGVLVDRTMHLQKGVYEIGYTRPGYCLTSEGTVVNMKFDRLVRPAS